MLNPKATEQGFTLLEVLIAMAIMLVAFSSILMVQSGALNASYKARQLNVVAMLAKGKMVETEVAFQGKTFEEFKKEDHGNFAAPFEDYKWKLEVKEVEFPNLSLSGPSGKEGAEAGQDQNQQMVEMITKMITNYLSKSIREVNVTILWQKGAGTQDYTVSTYWVNLNHEFSLTPQ